MIRELFLTLVSNHLVDMLCNGCEEICLWHICRQCIEPFVDAGAHLEMNVTFKSEYTGFHVFQIVGRTLLKTRFFWNAGALR